MTKKRTLAESFNCAIEGFIYVLKTQKNMKIHFLTGVVVLSAAIYVKASSTEIILLALAASLVLVSEMFNTAIEHSIDMFTEDFHPLARIIKDITAGAVMVSMAGALIAGYLVFQNRLRIDLEGGLYRIQQSPVHVTFMAILLALTLSVFLKLLLHKGTPLRGGMPSGHSAFVFSVWTIIVYMSKNGIVAALALFMAALVARSRIKERAHSVPEVLAGALFGVLVTTLVFQFLR